MEVWQIVLYGVAVVLTLRSLLGLMTAHKQRLFREMAARDEQQRIEELRRIKSEQRAAAKGKPRRNGSAA